MRITILGTGAMACLFGARLAAVAPRAITLVGTWPDGLAAIRRRGVVLTEPLATHAYPTQVALLGQPVPPAEIVLVLVKAWQTAQIAPHLPDLVKPDGVVISLQQSLGNLEQLGAPACLGVTELSATLLEPGYARSDEERPTFLAAPDWVVEVFRHAGLDVVGITPERAVGLLWGALSLRCALEPLSALLRLPYGELLRRKDALTLLDRAATECAMVAWAERLPLPFADPLFAVRHTAETLAEREAPMLHDLQRGTPTEIDALSGAVVRAADRLGVHATVNEILWRQIRTLSTGTRPRP